MMSYRDEAIKAVLAVERALTPDEQRDLLAHVNQTYRGLDGAHVADLLEMFENGDTCIRWTEPFWVARREAGRPASGVAGTESYLASYAAIAVAVLEQGVPDGGRVDALVAKARGELR